MKILLATPLYPPDIAPPAPYIKELARRLAGAHEVTVLAYGRLPEKVPGVKIITIDKRRPLFLRLFLYTLSLLKTARQMDVVYAENGRSVELPAALLTLVSPTPLILHVGDRRADSASGTIARLARARAQKVVTAIPKEKPEILPLTPRLDVELKDFEHSWSEHISQLEHIFAHAK